MKKCDKRFPWKPALLLGAAALLLLGSTVGGTRAALTYYSEDYAARVSMSSIGVTLLENGEEVSSRDYQTDGTWVETQGQLLTNMLGEGEKFSPGKAYPEALSVANTGNIDTFVRVIITRSWQDENGKDTSLDPNLIQLNLTEGNGWVLDDSGEYSDERLALYYTELLEPGMMTEALSDTIRIDPEIARDVEVIEDGNTIYYVYRYDGYRFCLEAEVNAVQTHNAQEAIKSAWGVDVTVSADGRTIGLQ